MLTKRLEGIAKRCRVGGDRGVETVEWIGLSAVILTLLLGMFSMMPLGGQAIGSQMHSTISNWVEVWSGGGPTGVALGGGSFASGGPYSSSLPEQMRGGAPGFGQSDYSVDPGGAVTGVGLVAPTNDQVGSVLGTASDNRPWGQRALGGLWGMIVSPFRPAGVDATVGTGSATGDPGAQFVDAIRDGLSILADSMRSAFAALRSLFPWPASPLGQPTISPPPGQTVPRATNNLREVTEPYENCVDYVRARRVDGETLPRLGEDRGPYLWAEMLDTYSVPDPASADLTDYIAPGDIVIFGKGVDDASETHGHAAIVESVYPDRIEISEANWEGNNDEDNCNARCIYRTAGDFADLRFYH